MFASLGNFFHKENDLPKRTILEEINFSVLGDQVSMAMEITCKGFVFKKEKRT